MKKQKALFNNLLIRYQRYRRKLQRLETAGRNQHRQGVLQKHIERLSEKLNSMYISIKVATSVGTVVAVCAFATPAANAQEIVAIAAPPANNDFSFGDVQTDPFSLTPIGYYNTITFADLDNDGDLDAMAGDTYGDFKYFQNTGSATAPNFATVQTNPFSLTNIGELSTSFFADLDNDGDLDLISGEKYGSFNYFENTGTVDTPSFGLVQTNPFSLTGVGNSSNPVFADLDNDGDLDLMTGEEIGNFRYFENTGTASAPAFGAVQTNPFALTYIIGGGDSGPFSKIAFVDLDEDGDLDIMSGEYYGNFLYYENIGTSTVPDFSTVQYNPFSLTDIGYFSTVAFADLDGDGDLDLMSGERYGNFKYFQNITPNFAPAQTNPFSLASTGQFGPMAFTDMDNDGDLDLMSGEAAGDFRYFQNIGTATAPSFEAVVTNPFSLTNSGYLSTVGFADLDNDGDIDLMSGDLYGNFRYFQNTGTSTVPSFTTVVTNPFSLTDIGYTSTVRFADLDNDGDLDLMSGERYGNFKYFENIGRGTPIFAAVQTNPFSLTDIGDYSTVTFADLDNDGDLDLMSGETPGNFLFFENIGTVTAPNFAMVQTNPFSLTNVGGNRSTAAFADLDNDGDLDLMAGQQNGSLFSYFENRPCAEPDVPTVMVSSSSICSGTTVTLTIAGNLNDALDWYIYSGSCAGTPVGTTATGSFDVSPAVTTTYYIRGEDGTGCVDESIGSCGSITITVEDTVAPVADLASLADVSDVCSVSSLTAPTATDNCAGAITGTHNAALPITTLGSTTVVTWTYDDGNGNISTQDQNIIIALAAAPIFLEDINVECSATPTTPVHAGNCGNINGIPDITFPITAQGTTMVTWTYDDGNGNTSTQTQNIVIDDVTTPVSDIATLADAIAECEVTDLTAPTATDNCEGAIVGTHNATLPIASQGTTIVTWTYNDVNGNTSTQDQNVVINDVTAPVADNATLADLTSECSVAMPTAPTASDNCAGTVSGTPNVTFPVTTQGNTSVTWTFDDGNGNTSAQLQDIIITPVDNTVSQSGNTLTANASGNTYQWIDCNNSNAPISGETNQGFTATTSGSYAVEINNGTCTVTSACTNITITSILSEVNNLNVFVYPNPSPSVIHVDLPDVQTAVIKLLSLDGKLIRDFGIRSGADIRLSVNDLQSGIYILQVVNGARKNLQKIIIN